LKKIINTRNKKIIFNKRKKFVKLEIPKNEIIEIIFTFHLCKYFFYK
jgi:hypothetical protein